jgi:predicted RNase H-like nuclease (RuvC/YqgF family)
VLTMNSCVLCTSDEFEKINISKFLGIQLESARSAREDSAWSGSVIRDYEKLSTCLMDKVCKFELEKKLLEEQSQDQQNEIYKLKANLESCEKAIDDCSLQHELEKDGILLEVLSINLVIIFFDERKGIYPKGT